MQKWKYQLQIAIVRSNCSTMSQPSTPALQPNYMKVFIQRDYSDGTSVKFQTRFPPELEGRVSIVIGHGMCHQFTSYIWYLSMICFLSGQLDRQQFEATICKLNEYFAEAEKGSCSTYWWVDFVFFLNEQRQDILCQFLFDYSEGCLACITAYLVYLCTETHYEKVNYVHKCEVCSLHVPSQTLDAELI